MRNAHVESESGAVIDVTVTEDFYNAAKNDILSGTYKYDLYAATAVGTLSRLLSDGDLHDVSGSMYMKLDGEHYDKNTMDNLSIHGGKYLVSSAAADARWWSAAIVYSDDFFQSDELQSLALSGSFTVDSMLAYGGLSYDRDDIYSMWFGAGGRFARYDGEEPSFISHKDFEQTVANLAPLAQSINNESIAFEVKTLYELMDGEDVKMAPLPKVTDEDAYGGYIDLAAAVLTAIPGGSPSADKSEYILERMAYLSEEYIAPYFDECFLEDAQMYDMIKQNASCDLSVLLDYGDMSELVAECIHDDTHLTLEYCNRKALYEKAFSIIEKRLKNNN